MATVATGRWELVLTQSKWLRLLTLLLFYFTQGFPIGVFLYAIPAWMVTNGASVAETASVVAAAVLPWTLKFVNGFVIDRYTYLPMGRRRIWIIGAQSLVVLSFVVAAVSAPDASEVALISAFAFVANFGIALQDVGIDSLAVDIMPEDERARAAGIMFGAQALGIATATALGGFLFENFGIREGLLALALIPLAVMAYGIAIREREGERLLPWTQGSSNAANVDIQVDAWWPLLRGATVAIFAPLSLLLAPILLLRGVPYGSFEAFHPTLYTQTAGWALTDYTNLVSTSLLISGVLLLVVGGWAVDRIGSRTSLLVAAAGGVLLLTTMGLLKPQWTNDALLIGFLISADILLFFYVAAAVPIYMRLCTPAVAATQFTIYMALGNVGRPIGAWLAGVSTELGRPELIYFFSAAGFVVVLLILLFVPLPEGEGGSDAVAERLVHGRGLHPEED